MPDTWFRPGCPFEATLRTFHSQTYVRKTCTSIVFPLQKSVRSMGRRIPRGDREGWLHSIYVPGFYGSRLFPSYGRRNQSRYVLRPHRRVEEPKAKNRGVRASISLLVHTVSLDICPTCEGFNDWGGRGYDDFVPGGVTKTAPSGDRTT